MSLLGIVGRSVTGKVLADLRHLAPGSARDIVTRSVEQLQNNAGTGSVMTVVGVVLAVWSASGYVAAFILAAYAVDDMPKGRPVWKILPLRIGVTVMLMVLSVAGAGPAGHGGDRDPPGAEPNPQPRDTRKWHEDDVRRLRQT